MRKFLAVALAGAVVAATLVGSGAPTSASAPAREQASAAGAARPDNHPGPLTARQEGRRKAAQQLILSGQASPDADVPSCPKNIPFWATVLTPLAPV